MKNRTQEWEVSGRETEGIIHGLEGKEMGLQLTDCLSPTPDPGQKGSDSQL